MISSKNLDGKITYNEVIMMVKLEESTPKIFGDKKRVN